MRIRFLLLFGLVLVLGCADSRYAPVSGKVTMDGKPLPNVVVMFQPVGGSGKPGPGSTGATNEKGEYHLEVIGGVGHGAVVGWHQVQIHPRIEGVKEPLPVEKLRRYMYTSELKYEVERGQNTIDISLTSP